MTETEIVTSSASVSDLQGDLVLRFNVFNGHDMDTFQVRVRAKEVAAFMRSVANHGASALEFVAQAWRVGDCGRCRNIRLVDEPAPGGRTRSAYCPDCNPEGRGAASTFANFPKVDGLR